MNNWIFRLEFTATKKYLSDAGFELLTFNLDQ
jgi:hypothetical protein